MMKFQKILSLAVAAMLSSAASSPAQALTVLHTFSATTNSSGELTNWDGAWPTADLVLSGSTLYGTALNGGTNGFGTIYSINTDGTGFTVLHTFTGTTDGAAPNKNLLLAGGTLYGLVAKGTNLSGYGGVFSMETNGGNFTLLYDFATNTDGAIGEPNGGLILCGNTLYGTAYQGGITNAGSIFSVDTNGNFQLLHLFKLDMDGEHPLCTLVMSAGTLYGTANVGGTNLYPDGTIFSISTAGTNFTVLHYFGGIQNASDGNAPSAGMILSGNTLYGTTGRGGTNNDGTVFSINTNGGDYTILHSFAGLGDFPQGVLLLHGDTLYGTALGDGTATQGSVFSLGTNGSNYTLLQTFSHLEASDNDTNVYGAELEGGLAMSGNMLYGSAMLGGAYGNGTLFSLAIEPVISSLNLAGTNLVLNATSGFAGDTWTVLASADLTTPLDEWSPIATNTLDADGDFTITATNAVDATVPQQFYILQQQ